MMHMKNTKLQATKPPWHVLNLCNELCNSSMNWTQRMQLWKTTIINIIHNSQ